MQKRSEVVGVRSGKGGGVEVDVTQELKLLCKCKKVGVAGCDFVNC